MQTIFSPAADFHITKSKTSARTYAEFDDGVAVEIITASIKEHPLFKHLYQNALPPQPSNPAAHTLLSKRLCCASLWL